jgi:hypothetical protein
MAPFVRDDVDPNWRSRWKDILRPQISIRGYMLVVLYVAYLMALYKISVWASQTYYP